MNLAKSSIKLFFGKLVSRGAFFFGIAYFSQNLGASQIGIFFLFQALLNILAIVADFGLRGAVMKRISEGESPGAFLSTVILIKLIPVALVVLVILLARSFINGYVGADLALFLALAIILNEAANLSVVILKGELRVGETAVLNVVQQLTWVGGGAVLISYGYGVDALIYSLLAGLTIMLVWGSYKISVSPSRPSMAHARSLTDYGKYNAASAMGGYFYSWMDVLIIGLFLTQAEVGAYETAWQVTAIAVLPSAVIATTLFPQVSQWDANGANQQIESIIQKAITPSMLFSIPSFFGVLVFSREILRYVFGPEFTIATGVLIILAGEKILNSIHAVLGRALKGINHPNLAARATIISVCLNLILNLLLIPIFGIVGAAIATTLSFAVNALLHARYLTEFITIRLPFAEIGWCALSSSIMALILIGVKLFIGIENLPKLLFVIAFGATIYGTLIMLYRPIREKVFANMWKMVPTEL